MIDWYWILIVGIVLFVIGGFIGFYVAQHVIKKQIKENPPISENQIRAMYMSMGRKPSESQVKETMRRIRDAK